jgi:hypothetical protein
VFGAFLGLFLRAFDNNVYTQIGLIMLVGWRQKRHPHRRVSQRERACRSSKRVAGPSSGFARSS